MKCRFCDAEFETDNLAEEYCSICKSRSARIKKVTAAKSKVFRITFSRDTLQRILSCMRENNTTSVNHYIRDCVMIRTVRLEMEKSRSEHDKKQ